MVDCDVLIVGGGPAGVSCALECHDVRLDYRLLEARETLGGQLSEVPNTIRNLAAGFFDDGASLRRSMERASEICGDRRVFGAGVTSANLAERLLVAGERRFRARAIVLATGRRRRRLQIAHEGAFGGDVTYQIEVHPARFAGREAVVIVGGGDSATLDALELAQAGSRVFLVHRRPELSARADVVQDLRAETRIEELAGWEIDSLEGDARLERVVLRSAKGERRVVEAQGLVVKIGYAPNTEAFRGQLALDPEGAIIAGPDLSTSRTGVFAAGDVVSGAYPRFATAMGQGAQAAASVLRFLQK